MTNRVRIPAYTDRFMMGDAYGEIVKTTVSKKLKDRYNDPVEIAHVKLDKSGKTLKFVLADCTEVD